MSSDNTDLCISDQLVPTLVEAGCRLQYQWLSVDDRLTQSGPGDSTSYLQLMDGYLCNSDKHVFINYQY